MLGFAVGWVVFRLAQCHVYVHVAWAYGLWLFLLLNAADEM